MEKEVWRKWYRETYLRSQHWQDTRILKLLHTNFQCEVCGCKDHLEIHHKHYNSLWREKMSDLQTLCDIHHEAAHSNNKVDLDAIQTARLQRQMQKWQQDINRIIDDGLDRITSRDVLPEERCTPEEINEFKNLRWE